MNKKKGVINIEDQDQEAFAGDGITSDGPRSMMPLPTYQCHKVVSAAKITAIEDHESDGTSSRTLKFGKIGASRLITDAYFNKHHPQVGGYYVVYEDGYKSFSPAAAFEFGYSRI